jgi:hypothetical protein
VRLLVAVLVFAALLWWLLQDDGAGRHERRDTAARREAARSEAGEEGAHPDAVPGAAAATAGETGEDAGASDAEAPPVRGRVQVRGRGDVPVAGVRFASVPALLNFSRATDRLGWTEWEAKKEPGESVVIVDSLFGREHAVEVPETTIRFPDLIPLEVDFVDALTGAVLEDADSAISLPPGRGETVYGRNRRTLMVAPIEAGRRCDFTLDLKPPKGTAGDFGLAEVVACAVSKRAHAAHLSIPVWPAMGLMLEFQDENGARISGVRLDTVSLCGRPLTVSVGASDGAGRLPIVGIPYWRGETLSIRAGGIEYSVRIGSKAQYTTLRGGNRTGEIDSPMRREESTGAELPEGDAALDVEARWLDREPALDVPVALGYADRLIRARRTDPETGIAGFDRLPAGEVRVAVLDAGLAYEERTVSLREGGRTAITVGPAWGRSITFAATRGSAGTRLVASSWYGEIAPPLFRGVQELAAVTGPKGVLTWHGFPAAAVHVRATRAGRWGETRVPDGVSRWGVSLNHRRR